MKSGDLHSVPLVDVFIFISVLSCFHLQRSCNLNIHHCGASRLASIVSDCFDLWVLPAFHLDSEVICLIKSYFQNFVLLKYIKKQITLIKLVYLIKLVSKI